MLSPQRFQMPVFIVGGSPWPSIWLARVHGWELHCWCHSKPVGTSSHAAVVSVIYLINSSLFLSSLSWFRVYRASEP